MEMRDNIPGLIERLNNISCVYNCEIMAIAQATVYLTYLYDILKISEENLRTGEKNDK